MSEVRDERNEEWTEAARIRIINIRLNFWNPCHCGVPSYHFPFIVEGTPLPTVAVWMGWEERQGLETQRQRDETVSSFQSFRFDSVPSIESHGLSLGRTDRMPTFWTLISSLRYDRHSFFFLVVSWDYSFYPSKNLLYSENQIIHILPVLLGSFLTVGWYEVPAGTIETRLLPLPSSAGTSSHLTCFQPV